MPCSVSMRRLAQGRPRYGATRRSSGCPRGGRRCRVRRRAARCRVRLLSAVMPFAMSGACRVGIHEWRCGMRRGVRPLLGPTHREASRHRRPRYRSGDCSRTARRKPRCGSSCCQPPAVELPRHEPSLRCRCSTGGAALCGAGVPAVVAPTRVVAVYRQGVQPRRHPSWEVATAVRDGGRLLLARGRATGSGAGPLGGKPTM